MKSTTFSDKKLSSKFVLIFVTAAVGIVIVIFNYIFAESMLQSNFFMKDLPSSLPEGWETCLWNPEGPPNQVTIINATIVPDPPKRGSKLSIYIEADLQYPINGGELEYMVSYSGIPLLRDTVEICELLRKVRDGEGFGDGGGDEAEPIPSIPQCPLRQGNWKYDLEITIPYKVPPGYYGLTSHGWSIDNEPIFCIKGSTYIAAFPPESKDTERLLAGLLDDNNFIFRSR